MSAGFHQIPMNETSKKYTTFSTSQGHYEFNRMPFGLKNSPATFQRMMDNAFRSLLTKDGVKPNPSKTEAVKNFKIPTTVKEIQSFLGLT